MKMSIHLSYLFFADQRSTNPACDDSSARVKDPQEDRLNVTMPCPAREALIRLAWATVF